MIGLSVWLVAFMMRTRVAVRNGSKPGAGADCHPEGPLTFLKKPKYWGGITCVIGLVLSLFSTYEVLQAHPRQPTSRPVVHRVVRFPELTLHGLVYDGSNSSAVINGRVCYLGERVEGVQVIMIDHHSVWVELDGQTNRLWLTY